MFSKRSKICMFAFSPQAVSSRAREVLVTVSLGLTDHYSYIDDFETHAVDKYRMSIETECETSCDFDLFKKYCKV